MKYKNKTQNAKKCKNVTRKKLIIESINITKIPLIHHVPLNGRELHNLVSSL